MIDLKRTRRLLAALLAAVLLTLAIPSLAVSSIATIAPEETVYTEADFSSLEIGDKGDAVWALQLRLTELGYLDDTVDGFFGKNTRNALIVFQISNDLEGTGIATPADQCVLFNAGALSATGEVASAYDATVASETALSATPTPKPEVQARRASKDYIGNRNTKKFHYSYCSSVDQMKESNKVPLTYDEAISRGYVPCKRCNP